MSYEDLMKPRYKVIADYPEPRNHPYYEVGSVIRAITKEDEEYFGKYQTLFKPLLWWEERKLEDMPEYVKHIATGKLWRVKQYDLPAGAHLTGNEMSSYWASMKSLEPATEADYIAWKKENP
jgi:hypothetical protein